MPRGTRQRRRGRSSRVDADVTKCTKDAASAPAATISVKQRKPMLKDLGSLFAEDDAVKRLTDVCGTMDVSILMCHGDDVKASVDTSQVTRLLLSPGATDDKVQMHELVTNHIMAVGSMARECTCGAWSTSDTLTPCTCFLIMDDANIANTMLRAVDTPLDPGKCHLFTALNPKHHVGSAVHTTAPITTNYVTRDDNILHSRSAAMLLDSADTQHKALGNALKVWWSTDDDAVRRPSTSIGRWTRKRRQDFQASALKQAAAQELWHADVRHWHQQCISPFISPFAATAQLSELTGMRECGRKARCLIIKVQLQGAAAMTIVRTKLEPNASNTVAYRDLGDADGNGKFSLFINAAQPRIYATSSNVLFADMLVLTESVTSDGADCGNRVINSTTKDGPRAHITNAMQFMEWQLAWFGGGTSFAFPLDIAKREKFPPPPDDEGSSNLLRETVRAALAFLQPQPMRQVIDVPTTLGEVHVFLKACARSLKTLAMQSKVGSYVCHHPYGAEADTVVLPPFAISMALRKGGQHWVDPYAFEFTPVESVADVFEKDKEPSVATEMMSLEMLHDGKADVAVTIMNQAETVLLSSTKHAGVMFFRAGIRFSIEMEACTQAAKLAASNGSEPSMPAVGISHACDPTADVTHKLCRLKRKFVELMLMCGMRTALDGAHALMEMDGVREHRGDVRPHVKIRDSPLVLDMMDAAGIDDSVIMRLVQRNSPCCTTYVGDMAPFTIEEEEQVDRMLATDFVDEVAALVCVNIASKVVEAMPTHTLEALASVDPTSETFTAMRMAMLLDIDTNVVDVVMTDYLVEEAICMFVAWIIALNADDGYHRTMRVGYVTTAGGMPTFTTFTGPCRDLATVNIAKKRKVSALNAISSMIVFYFMGDVRTVGLTAMSGDCGQGHVLFGYDLEPASVMGNPQTHSLLRTSHMMSGLASRHPQAWSAMVDTAMERMSNTVQKRRDIPVIGAASTTVTCLLARGPAAAPGIVGIAIGSCDLEQTMMNHQSYQNANQEMKETDEKIVLDCVASVKELIGDKEVHLSPRLTCIMFGTTDIDTPDRRTYQSTKTKGDPQFKIASRHDEMFLLTSPSVEPPFELHDTSDKSMASNVCNARVDSFTQSSIAQSRSPTNTAWEHMANLLGNQHAVHVMHGKPRVFIPALQPIEFVHRTKPFNTMKSIDMERKVVGVAKVDGLVREDWNMSDATVVMLFTTKVALGTLFGNIASDNMETIAKAMSRNRTHEKCGGRNSCVGHTHVAGRRGFSIPTLQDLADPGTAKEDVRGCHMCLDTSRGCQAAMANLEVIRCMAHTHTPLCDCVRCMTSTPHNTVLLRSLSAWQVSGRILGSPDVEAMDACMLSVCASSLQRLAITCRSWSEIATAFPSVARAMTAVADSCISRLISVDEAVREFEDMDKANAQEAKQKSKAELKRKKNALRKSLNVVRKSIVEPFVEAANLAFAEATSVGAMKRVVEQFNMVVQQVGKQVRKDRVAATLDAANDVVKKLKVTMKVLTQARGMVNHHNFVSLEKYLDKAEGQYPFLKMQPMLMALRGICDAELQFDTDVMEVREELETADLPITSAVVDGWLQRLVAIKSSKRRKVQDDVRRLESIITSGRYVLIIQNRDRIMAIDKEVEDLCTYGSTQVVKWKDELEHALTDTTDRARDVGVALLKRLHGMQRKQPKHTSGTTVDTDDTLLTEKEPAGHSAFMLPATAVAHHDAPVVSIAAPFTVAVGPPVGVPQSVFSMFPGLQSLQDSIDSIVGTKPTW